MLLCSAAGRVLSSHVAAQGRPASDKWSGSTATTRGRRRDRQVRQSENRRRTRASRCRRRNERRRPRDQRRATPAHSFEPARHCQLERRWVFAGLLSKINEAYSHRLLFVAAAGNDNANNDSVACFPSSYNAPDVVSVAANRQQGPAGLVLELRRDDGGPRLEGELRVGT